MLHFQQVDSWADDAEADAVANAAIEALSSTSDKKTSSRNRARRVRGGRGRGDKHKANGKHAVDAASGTGYGTGSAGSGTGSSKLTTPTPTDPALTTPAPSVSDRSSYTLTSAGKLLVHVPSAPVPPAMTVSVYLYDADRRVSSAVLRRMNIPEYKGGSHLTLHDVRAYDFDAVHAIVTGNRSIVCERNTKRVPPGYINVTPSVLRYLAQLEPDFTSDLTHWDRIQISRKNMLKLKPGDKLPEHGDGINESVSDIVDIRICGFGWMYYFGEVINS